MKRDNNDLDPWDLRTLTVDDFAAVTEENRSNSEARWVLYDYLLMWLDRVRSVVEAAHEQEVIQLEAHLIAACALAADRLVEIERLRAQFATHCVQCPQCHAAIVPRESDPSRVTHARDGACNDVTAGNPRGDGESTAGAAIYIRTYSCGCEAKGSAPLPAACPEHPQERRYSAVNLILVQLREIRSMCIDAGMNERQLPTDYIRSVLLKDRSRP